MKTLSVNEISALVRMVFPPLRQDRVLGILVDLPKADFEDNENWLTRRRMGEEWAKMLAEHSDELKIRRVELYAYQNTGNNNAQLPERIFCIRNKLPVNSDGLRNAGESLPLSSVFSEVQIFLAPTEYSATAPLKLAARKYHFRAATMPGFSAEMLPALKIDFNKLNERLSLLKQKLDDAEQAEVIFLVDNKHEFNMFFDLRYRTATISGGRFAEAGSVGNLPSGETYIVPYEGELDPESRTEGILPVQYSEHVLLYNVKKNRARSVEGKGEIYKLESIRLMKEPAYGNIAELGFGVLGDFGLKPIGKMLLDEKLGFHIAFGRSDHFGGFVGENQFYSGYALVHIDRIYIPKCQPRISVKSIGLGYGGEKTEIIMKDNGYTIF